MLQHKGGWTEMQLTVIRMEVSKVGCTMLYMHAGQLSICT